MEYKDYYKILNVDKEASQDDIKKAYRNLAKEYHPDINPGDKVAEDKFKEIGEAYEVLGDSEKRQQYDNFGSQYNFQNGYNFDPSQYGFGNNVRYEYRTSEGGDYSDFFNMFFGGGGSMDFGDIFGRGQTRGSRSAGFKGEDVEARLKISPEEGFEGASRKISIAVGNGNKTINFKIPKGVMDGEKIRLKGQGEAGFGGGQKGDLLLNIEIEDSQNFSIDGKNLTKDIEVYPWDAALGTEKTIDTLDGRILVKIPAGIQTDRKIRIPKKGYRDRSGSRGDLYLRIQIMNPSSLDDETRKLYEQIKEHHG